MGQLLGKGFARAGGALGLWRGFERASMAAWLERNARRWPSHPAAIADDGEALTWSDVNALANVVAHQLRNQGVGRGDRIAVLMANRPAAVAAMLGPAKIGAIAVPLDPGLSPRTLCHRLEGIQPRRVVVGEECVYALSAVRERLEGGIEGYLWCRDRGRYRPPRWAEVLPDASAHACNNPPESTVFVGRHIVAWLHTAGKGGSPRAVSLSHARWAAGATLVARFALGLTPADRIFIPTPLDTALAVVIGVGGALASGAALAMSRRREPASLWRAAAGCEASVLLYSGEFCRLIASQAATASDSLHGIRQLVGTGLTGDLWPIFRQRFGIERIMELYGETDGNTLLFNLFDHDDTVGISAGPSTLLVVDDAKRAVAREPDGRAKPASRERPGRLAVAITRRQAPDPAVGDPGTGHIIQDVRRHRDRYRLTDDILIQVPVAGRGQGWQHFRFVGRLDELFEVDGHVVNPRRVEAVLYGHDAVRLCAVHRLTGKAGEIRCAAVLETARVLGERDLRALAARVDDNLVEPERPAVLYVVDTLPLNRCFEVDRARIAEIASVAGTRYRYSSIEGTYRPIMAPGRRGADRGGAVASRSGRGATRRRMRSEEE